MLIDSLWILVGFALLIVGADFMVRGSVTIARRFGISPLVIGVTVVALGTSLPELMVCLRAAFEGAPGITVGNLVGSNIANILLILGVAAVILPVRCGPQALKRDGVAMLAGTAVFMAFGLIVGFTWVYGLVGIGLLAAYLYHSYRSDAAAGEDVHTHEAEEIDTLKGSMPVLVLITLGGLAGVIAGAECLVHGSVNLARDLGVSEEVIGLTLVAFGTSVPELATTIVAAIRRHSDVALGNVLGSNLFNLLGIMGATALVIEVPMPPKIAGFDIWAMAFVSVLLLVFMRTGWRIGRREGAVFLALYLAFLAAQTTDISVARAVAWMG